MIGVCVSAGMTSVRMKPRGSHPRGFFVRCRISWGRDGLQQASRFSRVVFLCGSSGADPDSHARFGVWAATSPDSLRRKRCDVGALYRSSGSDGVECRQILSRSSGIRLQMALAARLRFLCHSGVRSILQRWEPNGLSLLPRHAS